MILNSLIIFYLFQLNFFKLCFDKTLTNTLVIIFLLLSWSFIWVIYWKQIKKTTDVKWFNINILYQVWLLLNWMLLIQLVKSGLNSVVFILSPSLIFYIPIFVALFIQIPFLLASIFSIKTLFKNKNFYQKMNIIINLWQSCFLGLPILLYLILSLYDSFFRGK